LGLSGTLARGVAQQDWSSQGEKPRRDSWSLGGVRTGVGWLHWALLMGVEVQGLVGAWAQNAPLTVVLASLLAMSEKRPQMPQSIWCPQALSSQPNPHKGL
jgi:hypothetical protein